jgi:soluble lytic murein transglycosylase
MTAFDQINQTTPMSRRMGYSPIPNQYADIKQPSPSHGSLGQTPIDWDRAMDCLVTQESNGKQLDKNGNPTMSHKGAIGIAQILPSTGREAARLAGEEWDPNRFKFDADYNRTLGQAYLEKQYETFGSLDKAYAAYNAGPGGLQKAMNKAIAAQNPDDWLDYLPSETKKYVAKNMQQYTNGDPSVMVAGTQQQRPAAEPKPSAPHKEPDQTLIASSRHGPMEEHDAPLRRHDAAFNSLYTVNYRPVL